jgi:GntR family transcriptional regulator / MocR family aminotransferase
MELALQIQPDIDVPLHRQVYEQIRAAILSGRLRSRQRLPASRQLAQSLGLSRTTITQSYDQLISEGYLHTKPGAGTFVCAQIPDELLQSECDVTAQRAQKSRDQSSIAANESVTGLKTSLCETSCLRLSTYGHRLQTTADRVFLSDCQMSFRYGIPAMDLFPMQLWRRLGNKCAATDTRWMDYSPDPMGYEPLREQIAHYISQSRAVRAQPAQIVITNGTQQALGLIVRLLIDPGDAIALENPGYLSAKRVFSSSGAALVPVPVDSEGLRINGPNSLSTLTSQNPPAKQPKLVYVTPSHQFPTGVLMSLPRRLALLQWAQQANALIIEDDYDSEFRYSGRPVPALQGLDSYERVLYVGTFSKVMFPGLRLGYIVLPEALVPVFRRAKWLSDRQGAVIDQQALAQFIGEGHLAKHVRRMRSVYEGRRRSLIKSLAVEILGDAAGLHVMARLPTQQSDRAIIAQAKQQGVSLFSAQEHYWAAAGDRSIADSQAEDSASRGEFIFGFGGISDRDIPEAINRIRSLW